MAKDWVKLGACGAMVCLMSACSSLNGLISATAPGRDADRLADVPTVTGPRRPGSLLVAQPPPVRVGETYNPVAAVPIAPAARTVSAAPTPRPQAPAPQPTPRPMAAAAQVAFVQLQPNPVPVAARQAVVSMPQVPGPLHDHFQARIREQQGRVAVAVAVPPPPPPVPIVPAPRPEVARNTMDDHYRRRLAEWTDGRPRPNRPVEVALAY